MPKDKRKNPRLDFEITVIHDGKLRVTKNISPNGTFIRMREQVPSLPIRAKIDFSLDFPNTKRCIDVKGVVVHHGKNDDGMGIWFKKIEERNKEFIRRFILDYL